MLGETIHLSIRATESEEARNHVFKSATNVFFEGDAVPLSVAMDLEKMKAFITERLSQ